MPSNSKARGRTVATPPTAQTAAPPPPTPSAPTVTAAQRAAAQQDPGRPPAQPAAPAQAPAAPPAQRNAQGAVQEDPEPTPQPVQEETQQPPQAAAPAPSNALATKPLASEESRNLARSLDESVQYANPTMEVPRSQVPPLPSLPPLTPEHIHPDAQRELVRGNSKAHPREEAAQLNPGMRTFLANSVKVYAHRMVQKRGTVLDTMVETGLRVLAPTVVAEEYDARCRALGVPNDWADTRRDLLKALLRQVDPQTVAEVYAEVYSDLVRENDMDQ